MTPIPESVCEALAPLFQAHPIEEAMAQLVVTHPPNPGLVHLAESALEAPALRARPSLAPGIWLYVDALDRSHARSQQMPDATGSWWHAIMHRREGDFTNSQYWYRKVGAHPASEALTGFDANAFVSTVSEGYARNPDDLVAMQRAEWQALFSWCANQPA